MRRDWPDIWGGLALAAVGLSACGWALAYYDLGTLRRMGPGFFPTVLGAMLAALGLIVALPALRRTGVPSRVQPWAAAAVLASIVIFGLGLSRLGLVGATAASVLVASLPAPQPGWTWRMVLTLAVTLLTVLVFSFGLRMTLPLWPRLP
ncbi:Tripartite tricarboxylate transporter TctB family protein [Palleronia marisminoris]|uniref:Tripartite tricarboxylate transporter TctB family protein n=1 Tax=Palleronia marisminoris TaxID=315423 RepID=A0A1Y5TG59_9RHOB|nr:tripartite tricarboxylate transporter TctB family protein [Palleronia marisminoris]SFH32494.1 Tripartite tricarboxylate transporter TctB family protein [Palleronia marisminoris]SLN61163.1 Tripartite tricarboxylate transporter TctB family protein [Palleronia marisminoris]